MQETSRRTMLALLLTTALTSAARAQDKLPPPPKPDEIAPATALSKITIADRREPGDRLVVDGVVSGPDGKPLHGVSIYAYHTDANGHYDPNEPPNHQGAPRLKGYMRTDTRGHYHFTTIRPAPYPSRTIPAHVHFVVSMAGYKDVYLEMLFSDDSLVTDEHRAAVKDESRPYKFSICNVTRDAKGAWQCMQNVALIPK